MSCDGILISKLAGFKLLLLKIENLDGVRLFLKIEQIVY